ncbi:hypothetical protein D3C71_1105960 [compost metagenome]
MCQPRLFAIAAYGEVTDEAGLAGPAIAVGQGGECQALGRALELGRQMLLGTAHRLGLGAVVGIHVAELDDEVVLRAIDAQPVPEVLARHGADVAGMLGGEFRRQLDDDAAAFQVHVQRVLRRRGMPVAGRRGLDDFLRATVLGGCIGSQQRQRGEHQGQGQQRRAKRHREGSVSWIWRF